MSCHSWSRWRKHKVPPLLEARATSRRRYALELLGVAESESTELASRAIERLDVSPPIKTILTRIHAELTEAYRASFVEMLQVIRRQASAIERIQNTLNILVRHISPGLTGLPAAIRPADGDEAPDLATAVVVADPIGTGYTLTQADIANALNLTQPDVSVLIRAFKLREDGDCAVVVRKGRQGDVVNYHSRAIDRFRQMVANPPAGLSNANRRLAARVRTRLVLAGSPTPTTTIETTGAE